MGLTCRLCSTGLPCSCHLGEFAATIKQAVGGDITRTFEFASAVVDWILGVHATDNGLLASVWVFEYAGQNSTFSLIPGRDDVILGKIRRANELITVRNR